MDWIQKNEFQYNQMHMRIEKAGYICKVLRKILGNSNLDSNSSGYYLGNPIGSLCNIAKLIALIALGNLKSRWK